MADRTRRLLHATTVPATLHFLVGQPRYMAGRGFETHVVSSPGPDLDAFMEKEPGVVTHPVPMRRNPAPLEDLVSLWRLVRMMRRLRPDIVHTHTPKAGMLGTLAARIAGVPVVIHHIHGGVWMSATGLRLRIALATDRLTCMLAHRVFCVSESARREVVDRGLCPADKVELLGAGSINGVDAEGRFDAQRVRAESRRTVRARFGIPDDAVVVGFIGRLTAEKGVIELAEAWERLRDTHPRAHLLLVGPLDEETPLPPAVVDRLKGGPRIHLAGMDWNTPPLYAAMDIFVLPTYREGFPVVLLEAAAMALPIVASAVPGCVDAVVDGVTGTLVPARDPSKLASALGQLLANPEMRTRFGAAARRRVLQLFRQDVIWNLLAEAYAAGRGRR